MEHKICSFFGHRKFFDGELLPLLIKKIEHLIMGGYNTFLFGGYGQFDNICYTAVKILKEKYSHIKMVYVQAYYKPYDEYWEQFKNGYDEIIYPEIVVPLRFAITSRNQTMIDMSDFCIFYVNQHYGGAFQTLQYAKRKKKDFFNIGETEI